MLRIAPSAVEAHIRAELAASPPAVERTVSLGGKSHAHTRDPNRRSNAVYIIGSQPLPSPSSSVASLGRSLGQTHGVGASPSAVPMHAQFEQLALRMSKLVVDEETEDGHHQHRQSESGSGSNPAGASGQSIGEKTSATSSCAASVIFSHAGGSGWTSETEHEDTPHSAKADQPEPVEDAHSNARLSVLEGPSLLSRTAPLSVTPIPLPTPILTESGSGSGPGLGEVETGPVPCMVSPGLSAMDDQVSVKIADLGNAVHIGRHVTGEFRLIFWLFVFGLGMALFYPRFLCLWSYCLLPLCGEALAP